jgi:Leucine-rich repeat (LRR) protein
MWAKTGIIALRDAQLTALPPEVWELAASAQTVDLTNNQLTSLPLQFSRLTSLQKLHLGRNRLTHEGLPLSLQPAFDGLQMLSISHNMSVPPQDQR